MAAFALQFEHVRLDRVRRDAPLHRAHAAAAAACPSRSRCRAAHLDAHDSGRVRAVEDDDDEAAAAAQTAYHTLYLYQVLTLDRGTTSGLLVHDQNDVGILGSLPPSVDTQLLASWRLATPAPQDTLLGAIIEVLEETEGAVTSACKPRLASLIRRHYRAHPEGLKMQAGNPNVALAADHHRTTKP